MRAAYRLIVASDTAYSTLLNVFRHCIFVTSRQEIRDRLEVLIWDTPIALQTSYQPSTPDPASDQFPPLIYPADAEDEEEPQQNGDQYIDPDGIRVYLSDKGLDVDSESPYAEFSSQAVKASSSENCRTVFEEMCQSQRIRISISKLYRGKTPPP